MKSSPRLQRDTKTNHLLFRPKSPSMLPLLFSIFLPVTSLAKPNVLFIVSDDLRPNLGAYADVNAGVVEAPQMHTPNLDKVGGKC